MYVAGGSRGHRYISKQATYSAGGQKLERDGGHGELKTSPGSTDALVPINVWWKPWSTSNVGTRGEAVCHGQAKGPSWSAREGKKDRAGIVFYGQRGAKEESGYMLGGS